MEDHAEEPQVLDCKEAQKRLKCCLVTVYALFDRGELRGYKIGRKRIIYVASLEEYLKRREGKAVGNEGEAR